MSFYRTEQTSHYDRYREQWQQLRLRVYPQAHALQLRQDCPGAYFHTGILLYEGSTIAGCVAAYDNPAIRHELQPTLLAGCFECIEDTAAQDLLLQTLTATAQELHAAYILGPMNGSTWDDYRFALEPQDDPYFSEPLQQPYYPRAFTRNGFEQIHTYYSHCSALQQPAIDYTAVLQAMNEQDVRLRNADFANFRAELDNIYRLCMTAFSRNKWFSPIAAIDFLEKYLPLQQLLQPYQLQVAGDAQGHTIAFMLAFPDLLHPHRIVLKTIAKHPDITIKGLISLMGARLYEQAIADGYKEIIHAFMYEDNHSMQRSEAFGGKPFRSYGLFLKTTGV